MMRALKRAVLASLLAIGLLAVGAVQSKAGGKSYSGRGGGYGG